ncbi:hypothetical protein [Oryzibacter oryziterrae]|uniref:hypothetical protein n=1 Tax=Oryzibacter oryziterrae TaxID=2766474 RepID=UPI001F2AA3B9|nr:hypothetical protein [Oryzibacter oryziterrae]
MKENLKSDGSWGFILLLALIILLFFYPVIVDSNASHRADSLQWIAAIGGLIGPISAIFVSVYVFYDQKKREKSISDEYIRKSVHEEAKALYDIGHYLVELKDIYSKNRGNLRAEIDGMMASRANDVIDRFDKLEIWNNDSKMLRNRIDIIVKIKRINYHIARRQAMPRDILWNDTQSIDRIICDELDNVLTLAIRYKELLEVNAISVDMEPFIRAFVNDTKTTTSSARPTSASSHPQA